MSKVYKEQHGSFNYDYCRLSSSDEDTNEQTTTEQPRAPIAKRSIDPLMRSARETSETGDDRKPWPKDEIDETDFSNSSPVTQNEDFVEKPGVQQPEKETTHNTTTDAFQLGVVVQGTLKAMVKAQTKVVDAQQALLTELKHSMDELRTVLQAED